MHLLFVVSVLLQFVCLVHMVRSGRPYWWIWVIMLGSYLGVAVYFFTQILPELRRSPSARRAVRKVQRSLDPERERRRIAAELEVADTVANRLRLAGESLTLGDFDTAERLYAECLRGHYRDAPDVMLGLAGAQFGRGDHAAARATLEALIRANPDFRSPDGHLMYARCLEALGESEAALREYAALADGFPGEEGRTRHALLLKRCGRSDEAQTIFRQVLARSRVAPAYYAREQREWIERARSELRPDG